MLAGTTQQSELEDGCGKVTSPEKLPVEEASIIEEGSGQDVTPATALPAKRKLPMTGATSAQSGSSGRKRRKPHVTPDQQDGPEGELQ